MSTAFTSALTTAGTDIAGYVWSAGALALAIMVALAGLRIVIRAFKTAGK